MTAPAGISYLDGARLRRSLLAAADWVDAGRDELNRINVFPVPDGDTGTNFAMTLRAVAIGVRALDVRAPLPTVTTAMANACVFAARGNSGMLLSQFLLGFRDALGDRLSATAAEVADAIGRGADRLRDSLDRPVEGTILTVSREMAEAAERAARETGNFEDLMGRVLEHAQGALRRTPELLAALREAGVVDAGAKAFVRLFEGILRLIQGNPIVPAETDPAFTAPDAAALAEIVADRDYQFCTEVLVRGTAIPSSTDVRAALRPLGGSIVVLVSGELLKIHVHTNTPETVFGLARDWGSLEATKAEDMRQQHRALEEAHQRIALVVDSSCDLPDEDLDRHRIVVVPVQVVQDGRAYHDRVEIRSADVYPRMRRGEVFTTSQPTPAAFAQGLGDALSGADRVLAILLAKALSGTYASGVTAAKAVAPDRIDVVDSRSASLGLGLLALRAAELIEAGWDVGPIARELGRVRDQSGGLFTVDVFDNLLRSGRVGRGRAWLGTLLDVKPILEITGEGRVAPLDRVRGRAALIPRVLRHIERRLTPAPRSLRVGIVHADAPEVADRLRDALVTRFGPKQCIVNDITAALGVHTGPGAWGVFYQVEDGPDDPATPAKE